MKWIKARIVPLRAFRNGMRVKVKPLTSDPALCDGDSVLRFNEADGRWYLLSRARGPFRRTAPSWIPEREPRKYAQVLDIGYCLDLYGDAFQVAFPPCPKRG